MDFEIGDYVEIVCNDGRTFTGVLMDFDTAGGLGYFVLTPGLGFVFDNVLTMTYA